MGGLRYPGTRGAPRAASNLPGTGNGVVLRGQIRIGPILICPSCTTPPGSPQRSSPRRERPVRHGGAATAARHAGASAQHLAEVTTSTIRTLLHLWCPAALPQREHRAEPGSGRDGHNDQQRPCCVERGALRFLKRRTAGSRSSSSSAGRYTRSNSQPVPPLACGVRVAPPPSRVAGLVAGRRPGPATGRPGRRHRVARLREGFLVGDAE